ncbi:acetyl-CoA carboxylase biotin carboxylase subunit [Flavisolibacter ginsenosidimutans]|uniref:Biotin carboxylase n=1 Tax=Flavisolibacter ginsenosidimutans TaxID=661481 RepID=A0A5B8UNJ4_9BACT|nr:acetyl-CoA carboxylase biotin carboxylase subunit [Flavisolibacter ginsenosidimutans]QEC58241.1 acetyl-CoA carboxylase biotin carboxylase subunit [Flavisolibacter ginsenosidimutans]
MFKKILIANRGEIALRVIRTCREMGIKTVAVYSTADRDSLHVRFADEAVCIGKPQSSDSYLNIPHIMAAVEITNADAVHPGYGFLAENAKFSQICADHGIKFIGPTSDMINRMGDKISAKETMIKAGVPVIPGSEGLLDSLEQAKDIARDMSYPVILKATAGGGGKGMRIVWEESEMERAYNTAKAEAAAAFKNDGIYMEKFVEEPRHIEIQVAGDQYGTVCHMGERDCSIQRRHQKLVEESPSPFMTPELREKMGEAAKKAAGAINYESVGTIEFLVDKHRNFYFMEMNTRIQVEHCVTEEVINFDLIKEQIKIAMGEKISGRDYVPQLHAIECRINAEDPYNDFRPSPGRITVLHQPGGHGVRVDSHVYAGYVIPPYYDSMIGKLITVAQTRSEAIDTMYRALSEYVIEGVKTTIPFHLQLMKNERFRSGDFNTKFLETFKMQ